MEKGILFRIRGGGMNMNFTLYVMYVYVCTIPGIHRIQYTTQQAT